MTPLRKRFIEDMQLRGLAPTTQRSYLDYVADFATFYHTTPEQLDLEAIHQYELHLLHERKLSPESVNTFVSAVQFLYLVTLEMPWGKECFPRARRAHKLPVVLSPEEVGRFFEHVGSLKHRAALMLCYGAGLRIFEAVKIRLADIDSDRMMIRIVEGKGRKDRYVMLSLRLLKVLRCKAAVYAILFRATAQTLLTIARDPKHLGAEIGFFGVLHTWGQNLHHHPHIHCVIPAADSPPTATTGSPAAPVSFCRSACSRACSAGCFWKC